MLFLLMRMQDFIASQVISAYRPCQTSCEKQLRDKTVTRLFVFVLHCDRHVQWLISILHRPDQDPQLDAFSMVRDWALTN